MIDISPVCNDLSLYGRALDDLRDLGARAPAWNSSGLSLDNLCPEAVGAGAPVAGRHDPNAAFGAGGRRARAIASNHAHHSGTGAGPLTHAHTIPVGTEAAGNSDHALLLNSIRRRRAVASIAALDLAGSENKLSGPSAGVATQEGRGSAPGGRPLAHDIDLGLTPTIALNEILLSSVRRRHA